jgi:hypothetical protein
MNFDTYLFHPSAFHKLVTEPKTKADKKAGNLSVTTISELRKIYREEKYQRKCGFESKYTDKGLIQEDNAITLVSRLEKRLYIKNTIRITNDYLTGEPDLVDNKDIMKCLRGCDIKCAWSLWTFPFADDELSSAYEWQNHCYMFLTGAKEWETKHCLMNAPADLITNEKKAIWYKMGMPDESEAEYVEKCIEIEKNMIFDMGEFLKENPYGFDFHCTDWQYDIPMSERVVTFLVKRDEAKIEKIKSTVERCRIYLNNIDNPINIAA